ncbi:hypothetical protein DL98DRAFT_620176 [Cadophora sp. DSE1049]|nr:hypothetical protein DL98DRAFT_620176 [Cadophora sp. DSE1049]
MIPPTHAEYYQKFCLLHDEQTGRPRNISFDLKPATMGRVLEYMYSGDYKHVSESQSPTRVPSAGAVTAPILISDAPSERPQTATSSSHTEAVENMTPQDISSAANNLEPLSATGSGALVAHAQMFFVHKDEFTALATAHPDFAILISRAMVGLIASEKLMPPSKECQNCKKGDDVRTSIPRCDILGKYYCEACKAQFD